MSSSLDLPDYDAKEITDDLLDGKCVVVLASNYQYGKHLYGALRRLLYRRGEEFQYCDARHRITLGLGEGKVYFAYNYEDFVGCTCDKAYLAVGSWRNMNESFIKNAHLLRGYLR